MRTLEGESRRVLFYDKPYTRAVLVEEPWYYPGEVNGPSTTKCTVVVEGLSRDALGGVRWEERFRSEETWLVQSIRELMEARCEL